MVEQTSSVTKKEPKRGGIWDFRCDGTPASILPALCCSRPALHLTHALQQVAATLYAGGIILKFVLGWNVYVAAIAMVVATGCYTAIGGLRTGELHCRPTRLSCTVGPHGWLSVKLLSIRHFRFTRHAFRSLHSTELERYVWQCNALTLGASLKV